MRTGLGTSLLDLAGNTLEGRRYGYTQRATSDVGVAPRELFPGDTVRVTPGIFPYKKAAKPNINGHTLIKTGVRFLIFRGQKWQVRAS